MDDEGSPGGCLALLLFLVILGGSFFWLVSRQDAAEHRAWMATTTAKRVVAVAYGLNGGYATAEDGSTCSGQDLSRMYGGYSRPMVGDTLTCVWVR